MSTTPHQWFYMKKTVLSEDQVGPVSEAELKDLIFSGIMKPDTRLSSPTRTKGQWRVMKSIPTLLKLYESGIADRKNQKVVEKQAKAAAKISDNEIKQQFEAPIAMVGASIASATLPSESKAASKLQVVAILNIIVGIITLTWSSIYAMTASWAFSGQIDQNLFGGANVPDVPGEIMGAFYMVFFIICLGSGIISILAGIRMMKRSPGAKGLGITAGIINCTGITWGCCAGIFTLPVGIYSLVVLCRSK